MDIIKLQFNIVGTKPLVVHNIRLADKREPIVKEIDRLADRPASQKTAFDEEEMQRLKWHGSLYYDLETGYYLPTAGLIRCLENAGKAQRAGTAVVRALTADDPKSPLDFPQKELKPEELWERPEYAWRTMVSGQGKKGGGKVPNTRPIFSMNGPNWKWFPEMYFDESALDFEELEIIAQRAGYVEGLFDARKLGYGRFTVEIKRL